MDAYKIFIPSAGVGSRLHNLTDHVNKALVSVGLKPNISYIIEKFDDKHEFVIAIGYKGDLIEQFVKLAYPNHKFTFVKIDDYDGPSSGLGRTILQAQQHLQCPFIFISNDTLIADEIPTADKMIGLGNWIGYSKIAAGNDYRAVEMDDHGKVITLHEKSKHQQLPAYIGVCGIKDYVDFWKIMNEGKPEIISTGESYALSKMVEKSKFEAINFEWYDTGNIEALEEATKRFKKPDDPTILQKPDESIWFINKRVVKFHTDKSFIYNRVARSTSLLPYVPEIIDHTDNMYAYKLVNGTTLSKSLTTENFKYLLDWLDRFWSFKNLSTDDTQKFNQTCMKFYRDKTLARVNAYFERFNNIDNDRELINGKKVPSIATILKHVDWDDLANGVPVTFHGDLHVENILITDPDEKLPFALLDWRQDFGGEIKYGDLYYDLAKLLHGLIVSHELIRDNQYSFRRSMNEVHYDFFRKNINIDCESILENYVIDKGYSYKKVRTMTALIFINIAAMHHFPYCNLLFYLGKNLLYSILEE